MTDKKNSAEQGGFTGAPSPHIRILVLDKPELKHIKMNCDSVIHEKLTKYPMIEDCFSRSNFSIICGKMGYGKTSLCISLMKSVYNKCFEYVYCFIPENSRQSIENDILGKNLPPDQLYSDLTQQNLEEVYGKLKSNSKDECRSLVVIDDFQAQLKDPEIVRVLELIITKNRHLRTCVILLQQNFVKLAKPIRNLVSNLILFNVGKAQLEQIFTDLIELDKSKFQELIKIAFQDKHDWICINNISKRIYKGMDELILEPTVPVKPP